MAWGVRAECPECGRDIAVSDAGNLYRHKDVDGDGEWCSGARPKGNEDEERMRQSHKSWAQRERDLKERGF